MSNRRYTSVNDPDFENIVTQWYNDLENEDVEQFIDDPTEFGWIDEDDDDEPNETETAKRTTETDGEVSHSNVDLDQSQEESSQEDEEEESIPQNKPYFMGKDNTKWLKTPPIANVRTRLHNIVLRIPGPKGAAKQAKTEFECLTCFIDDNFITKITQYTNIYISQVRDKFRRVRDARDTDEKEIKALIGILYLAGLLKSGRQNISQMWDNSKGTGVEAIYLTMSKSRFQFLMRCLRFDDITDRAQRRKLDKLAPIREIFDYTVNNFQKAYNPSSYVTIDEQLIAFRGKCSFRQYIPSKPAKYGIKIFALVDTKNAYAYNLEIYAGTQPEGPFQTTWSGADVVKRMIKPIDKTSRNITVDNWFTSVPLALELLEKHRLTLVGTLRKNKKEIPKEFLLTKGKQINDSLFGFHKKGCTIVSYMPKKNKVVLLISTMHNDNSIDEETGDQQKPEIVTFYNHTKYGVDLLDQLCAQYDVSRNSRRWPLTVFFDLLNICGVNAYCLHKANNNDPNVKFSRRKFLETISFDLLRPHMLARLQNPQTSPEIKHRIRKLLHIQPEPIPENAERRSSVGRCYLCGRQRNKSTRKWCHTCGKWVCPVHIKEVCLRCSEDPQEETLHEEDE